MSFIVAGAALMGFLAGPYIRALAHGFGPSELTAPAAARPGPDEATAREAMRRAHREEARHAFRALVRAVPRPVWPPVAEAGAAVACGVVAWRFAGSWELAAWLYAALAGCALAMIDWRTRRLPDAITLPSYPILAILLVPTGHLGGGLLGGLALAGAYAIMWFVRPDALGFGDVKLAGLVGMLLGALGLDAWLVGALAGQFLGALYAVTLLLARRATAKTQFPLGPFILLGTLAPILT
ncbi:prepilin peptidase [Sphaerisporangium album]|uniref:Prepilin peptidase n=1 Tax=Sphaerisporangium album TaxID=509200 RepID=A0A367FG56_9ACTN|nr:A24 family peptidase [Sphaerisporangium album]RCG29356.1 prepilin peptidase [Sphaerisporangium album]